MPSRDKFAALGRQEGLDADARSRDDRGRTDLCGGDLLTTRESARRLGVSVASIYDWLSQSDRGTLVIRGASVTIDYFQTGRRGQGRIHLEAREVDRLKSLLRVRPQKPIPRREPVRRTRFPGISVELGRPPNS
jgi:type IV secretory pathway ATPase VirB11/archaellum biosynthesis ATPase